MTSQLHLAQVNIGRMKGPLDSAVMAGFADWTAFEPCPAV
jgi:hypothetical protein